MLDGRAIQVPGQENGFYVGPTILDRVTEEMSVGTQEIFGPVLCFKRVKTFEEGLQLMNNNPFANGSVIFTQSGYYAREFQKRTTAAWSVSTSVSRCRSAYSRSQAISSPSSATCTAWAKTASVSTPNQNA